LSFSLIIPKSFATDLDVGKGDFVNVYTEEKKAYSREKAQ
jgi:hypothetical protein